MIRIIIKYILRIIVLYLSLNIGNLYAQHVDNLRYKFLYSATDTVFIIDTLSIVPGSVLLQKGDTVISEYYLDVAKAILILPKVSTDTLKITYRVFPYNFSKPYYHKQPDTTLLKENTPIFISPIGTREQNEENTLTTNGSISRGFSIGNNQDVYMNSSLNLQIHGDLTDDIKVEASISDQNIPLQPDGYTQQIQDFDKVYIKLYNETNSLQAGDFEVWDKNGHFLKYYKKAQGLKYTTTPQYWNSSQYHQASFAGSKGKYCRKQFNGVEGNQGPYKLTGCNEELYIIVLSGSETVYLEERKLTRGQDMDYVIDYNTGEITFTPRRMITKDSRITVEFEYSEKNYARFLFTGNNEVSYNKSVTRVNYFMESDSKNQPNQINLDQKNKTILRNAGDNPAYIESAVRDSSFDINIPYYLKKDTLVYSTIYTIYVHSPQKTDSLYRVSFSYTGKGKGDYVIDLTGYNGKIYRWIAPNLDGSQNGDFMPVYEIAKPESKRFMEISNTSQLTPSTKTDIVFAYSDYDKNTFSDKNNHDNKGNAVAVGVEQILLKKHETNILSLKNYNSFINKHYTAEGNFRNVEFNRQWNVGQSTGKYHEYFTSGECLVNLKLWQHTYGLDILNKEQAYTGYRNRINGNLKYKGFGYNYVNSVMQSKDTNSTSVFYATQNTVYKKIKKITVGYTNAQEINLRKTLQKILSPQAEKFYSNKVFMEKTDTGKWNFTSYALSRSDFMPDTSLNTFTKVSISKELNASVALQSNVSHTFSGMAHYRTLEILDTTRLNVPVEKTFTSSADHQIQFLKRLFRVTTSIEKGAGLEAKKQFIYIPVPEGQGTHYWSTQTDYNKNSLPDINEFEVPRFPGQANYIRTLIPTHEYIRALFGTFNQSIYITPSYVLKRNTIPEKIVYALSSMFSYSNEYKTTRKDMLYLFSPYYFHKDNNDLIHRVNSIRNTVWINRTGAKWGVSHIYLKNNHKNITVYGLEQRSLMEHTLTLRLSLTQTLTYLPEAATGIKTALYESQVFTNKNYTIRYYSTKQKIAWQPSAYYVNENWVALQKSHNTLPDNETLGKWTIGNESRVSHPQYGSVSANVQFTRIKYPHPLQTAIANVLTEGLMPGNNVTWQLIASREIIKKLFLQLSYDGQKSASAKAIHIGTVRLSAFF
ncbi:MAG: hypothetical protein SNJ71_03190 [Bacteroidales bacterium]